MIGYYRTKKLVRTVKGKESIDKFYGRIKDALSTAA